MDLIEKDAVLSPLQVCYVFRLLFTVYFCDFIQAGTTCLFELCLQLILYGVSFVKMSFS